MNFQPGAIVEIIDDTETDKTTRTINGKRSRIGMIGTVVETLLSTVCAVEFDDADGTKHRDVYNYKKLKPVMHTTIDTEQDEKIADFIGNF